MGFVMNSFTRFLIVTFFLTVLLAPTLSFAKKRQYYLGINFSQIDAAGLSQEPGFVLGWGSDSQQEKNYGLHTEFNLVARHTELLNKVARSYPGYISRYDFKIDLVYFQIPLLFKVQVPEIDSDLNIYVGPSVLLCMYNHVRCHYLKRVFNPDYDSGYYDGPIEAEFIEDPGIVKSIFDSSSIEFICGFDYKLWGVTTGLRYSMSMLRQPEAIRFNKRLHSVTWVVKL